MPRNEHHETLRQVLQCAKKIICGNPNAITTNGDLYDDTLSAFSEIGKERIYELSDIVYEFLDCDDHILKERAIATLGFGARLHLPDFKDVAYKIWLEDPHESVKNVALCAWGSYYLGTRNPKVIEILYRILVDESNPVTHRRSAMEEMFYVSQEPSKFFDPFKSRGFYDPDLTNEKLNKLIDWEEITTIIQKYAPEAFVK